MYPFKWVKERATNRKHGRRCPESTSNNGWMPVNKPGCNVALCYHTSINFLQNPAPACSRFAFYIMLWKTHILQEWM